VEGSYRLQHSKDQHRYWITCTRLQRLYDASKEETAAGPQQEAQHQDLPSKNIRGQRQAEIQQQAVETQAEVVLTE